MKCLFALLKSFFCIECASFIQWRSTNYRLFSWKGWLTCNHQSRFLAVPVKLRFTLKFEGDRPQLQYHLAGWKERDQEIMVSPAALVKIDRQSQRMQLFSRIGYAQRVIIVNRRNDYVIGTVEITAQGSLMLTDGKKMKTGANWQTLYTTQTVAVIGIEEVLSQCPSK